MSELRINNITDRSGSCGPIIAGVSTVSSTSHMVVPSGPTEMRKSPSVMDLSGSQQILSLGERGRAVFARGTNPGTYLNTMDFVTIASTGNAIDFGDSSMNDHFPASCASSTRGLIMGGGGNPAEINLIEYVTISSSGGANDFGDLRIAYYASSGLSNSTRGIVGGGQSAPSVYNTFTDFVTITTTGNSSFFGNLTARANMNQLSSAASPTRGLFGGGVNSNLIEFVTISTLGDAVDFGNLTIQKWMGDGGFSSPTRALFAGGYGTPALRASIDFVTIATLGNAQDFGDLTDARQQVAATSSSTRGVVAGGETPSITNIIDFVTIASAGNATDFGDLTAARRGFTGFSDVHGGLGD